MAIGITFTAMMHPSKGLINKALGLFGAANINWLGNPDLALYSIIGVDVWKGLSIATVIYVAGIQSIDKTYYEAAEIDGANARQKLFSITAPLARPAMNSVIILSFIGGLRSFDLIWAMTGGGPGFATDVMSSIVYKQYAVSYTHLTMPLIRPTLLYVAVTSLIGGMQIFDIPMALTGGTGEPQKLSLIHIFHRLQKIPVSLIVPDQEPW